MFDFLGDFPDIVKMQDALMKADFSRFHSLKPKLLDVVDKMLAQDISYLMTQIPREEGDIPVEHEIQGGVFEGIVDQLTPFGFQRCEGVDAGYGEPEWIVHRYP